VTDATNAFSRRRLLAAGAGLAAASFLPGMPAFASTGESLRKLSFKHLHTGERLTTTFWAEGRYRPDAMAELQYLLRDWRNGLEHPIDQQLYDLLYALRHRLDSAEPFEIISAYRSPETNAALRKNSNGVAKRSLHMDGMAIDIHLPGRRLDALRDAAWAMQRGGVGYYPKSGFVHVDTGRVRRWGG
jgi:uncharacterized protein YcbK (DUF882 family)